MIEFKMKGLPLTCILVLSGTFFKQNRVNVHEQLHCIVNQPMYISYQIIKNQNTETWYLFQCDLEFLYRAPKSMGRMTLTWSVINWTMYSLFQKYRARSATWKCGLEIQRAIFAKRSSCTLISSWLSTISRISSTSFRNITLDETIKNNQL